jgi:hypothetical protein
MSRQWKGREQAGLSLTVGSCVRSHLLYQEAATTSSPTNIQCLGECENI